MASLMQEEARRPFRPFDSEDHNSTKAGRVSNQEWDSVKPEIENLYIDQDQTLAATMQKIEADHGLKARQVPRYYSPIYGHGD